MSGFAVSARSIVSQISRPSASIRATGGVMDGRDRCDVFSPSRSARLILRRGRLAMAAQTLSSSQKTSRPPPNLYLRQIMLLKHIVNYNSLFKFRFKPNFIILKKPSLLELTTSCPANFFNIPSIYRSSNNSTYNWYCLQSLSFCYIYS